MADYGSEKNKNNLDLDVLDIEEMKKLSNGHKKSKIKEYEQKIKKLEDALSRQRSGSVHYQRISRNIDRWQEELSSLHQ